MVDNVFSSPAWRMAARDRWVGWDDAARARNLQHVVNNSRFLRFVSRRQLAEAHYVTRDDLRAELAEMKVDLIEWMVGTGPGIAAVTATLAGNCVTRTHIRRRRPGARAARGCRSSATTRPQLVRGAGAR